MGRTALVVGATGAIGEIVARTLHALGYSLVLTHRSGEPVHDPVPGRWVKLDVTDADQVTHVLADCEREAGRPFALVYAAGINRDRPLLTMSQDDWRDVVETNLSGAYFCIRAVARSMLVAGEGRIVLIGSVAGRRAVPGQIAYSTAKAGIEAMCRVTALELGRSGVTCNVVAPGAIESPMFQRFGTKTAERTVRVTPLRRLGEPAEVAAAVGYLLSDEAAFVTGQCIGVDGGLSIA
jgi:NAD(P)-dependent dehydrogenase (short-subunit alcohol dehydrogenase family)